MPRRICDSCGKEKDVRGGKTCESGHFICQDCVYGSGLQPLISSSRKQCPICGKQLR